VNSLAKSGAEFNYDYQRTSHGCCQMDTSVTPILDAARLMQGFSSPWFISGGWTIDLFLGYKTREHADIEIGIYRCDQAALQYQLSGWSFDKAIETPAGNRWDRWDHREDLRLPVHQIRAKRLTAGPAEFDFLLNERSDTHWTSRRHPGLARPLETVATISWLGVPALAPEIQLLFKAKQTRPKDQMDFESSLPRLTYIQRNWLAGALRRYHPDHAWLDAVANQCATERQT
jgi:hypothetical protein